MLKKLQKKLKGNLHFVRRIKTPKTEQTEYEMITKTQHFQQGKATFPPLKKRKNAKIKVFNKFSEISRVGGNKCT